MSAKDLDLPTLHNPEFWIYKVEGNANVVFTYVGPAHLQLTGYLLRVRKSCHPKASGFVAKSLSAPDEKRFQEQVVSPLLGEAYVAKIQLVKVSGGFLRQLAVLAHQARPRARLIKDLDVTREHAYLVPDLSVWKDSNSPSVTIEIKPKWGFLPTSTAIDPNNAVKFRTCRYCMHQYYKQRHHAGREFNKYCPLDLFSGQERARKAVGALLQDPQNNMRAFVGSGSVSTESVEFRRAITFLLQPISTATASPDDLLSNALSYIISEQPLFRRLKFHQAQLDALDVEGIFALLKELPDPLKTRDPTMDEWIGVLERYLARVGQVSCAQTAPGRLPKAQNVTNTDSIYEFLLSATLKDCSVMITLRLQQSGDGSQMPENEGVVPGSSITPQLRYKVGIVDTDPKCILKIDEHFRKDQAIVSYFKSLKISKTCCP